MKKLLITMISAVALFTVARADDVEDPEVIATTTWDNATKSGLVDFESYVGDFSTANDDTGSPTGNLFWLEATDAATIVDVTGEYTGALTLGTKALKVDTEARLERKIDVQRQGVEIDSGIFFDSLVQFTASDAAPTPQTGDKLIVWLYSGEEDGLFGAATNLIVTSGKLDEDELSMTYGQLLPHNFKIDNLTIEPNTWHRLTIKSFCDAVLRPSDKETYYTRFEVLIDGEKVSTVVGKDDQDAEIIVTSFESLQSANERVLDEGGDSDPKKDHLFSVAFQGCGLVDQMEFTNEDPFPEIPDAFDFVLSFNYRGEDASTVGVPVDWLALDADDELECEGDEHVEGMWTVPVPTGSGTYTLYAFVPEAYELQNWAKGDYDSENEGYVWSKTFTFADMIADQDGNYAASFELVAAAVESVAFTIDVPAGWTIQYDLGDGLVAYDSATGAECPINTSVRIVITNGDGITKEFNEVVETAEQDILLNDEDIALAWEDYLGDAVEGAYQITDEDDLFMFLKGVNNAQLATTGETFVLTDDIEMTQPWPGIGIYKQQEKSVSFNGTFDGKNYEISNLVFANVTTGEKNKYRGFFNQAWDSTIKNVTITTTGFEAAAKSGSHGGAILVGHVFNTTVENCTTKGQFSGTHNIGGIVCRANRTLVKNCTNEANLSGNYTKLGGIVCFEQDSQGTAKDLINYPKGNVTVENCVNKGNITVTAGDTAGRDGVAGIVGSGQNPSWVELKGCSNTGIITSEGTVSSAFVPYQIVGPLNAGAGTTGQFSGRADTLASHRALNGLKYATIEDDGATFVYDADLEAGKEYRIMVKGFEPAFALGAEESISFDCALLDAVIEGTGITLNEALDEEAYEIVSETEGNVITFTAQAKSASEGFILDEGKNAQETADAANSGKDILISGTATSEMITDDASGNPVITVGGVAVTLPKYYSVSVNAAQNGFALTLNDLAKPIISEAEVDEDLKPAIEVVDGKFVVTLKDGFATLYYSLWECDAPNGTFTKVAASESTGAAAFQLEASTGVATKKFYKVVVTDVAPAK